MPQSDLTQDAALPMTTLKYLAGYANDTLQQVQKIIDEGRLGEIILSGYRTPHGVRTDKQLYDYSNPYNAAKSLIFSHHVYCLTLE
jgi:hypothetical protein